MTLDDFRLHRHFAQHPWRRTTIVGTADETQLRYFQDSAYAHVELDAGRYTALIDHRTTDVRGHWFLAARPLFSSRVHVPLGDDRWMELVHEPPPEVLEGLHLAVAEAERKSDCAEVLVGELPVYRNAVAAHRRQFVAAALERAGLTVDETAWRCTTLENLAETKHGLVRTGELPTFA